MVAVDVTPSPQDASRRRWSQGLHGLYLLRLLSFRLLDDLLLVPPLRFNLRCGPLLVWMLQVGVDVLFLLNIGVADSILLPLETASWK